MSGYISILTDRTYQKQRKPMRDDSAGCLKTHWTWGKNAINYCGEVSAVCKAATQLLDAGLAPARIVFLIDSQAAISALSSNTPTHCFNVVQN
ncbi:hypothetical protein TNCV_4854831 [Trichonephila clavipes]|nr:hypothetical protein TNCV_4854831 [Trichonephila clavipes]